MFNCQRIKKREIKLRIVDHQFWEPQVCLTASTDDSCASSFGSNVFRKGRNLLVEIITRRLEAMSNPEETHWS